MTTWIWAILPLLSAWLLDLLLGDPLWLPHPVVWFGKMISFGEHRLNHGAHRKAKGALLAVLLIVAVFLVTMFLRQLLPAIPLFLLDTLIIF